MIFRDRHTDRHFIIIYISSDGSELEVSLGGESVTAELPSGVRTGGLYVFGAGHIQIISAQSLIEIIIATINMNVTIIISKINTGGVDATDVGLRACIRGVVIDGERRQGKEVRMLLGLGVPKKAHRVPDSKFRDHF